MPKLLKSLSNHIKIHIHTIGSDQLGKIHHECFFLAGCLIIKERIDAKQSLNKLMPILNTKVDDLRVHKINFLQDIEDVQNFRFGLTTFQKLILLKIMKLELDQHEDQKPGEKLQALIDFAFQPTKEITTLFFGGKINDIQKELKSKHEAAYVKAMRAAMNDIKAKKVNNLKPMRF